MLQGAAFCPQKCHNGCAPTSFIWCQLRIAEMLLEQRTKGRVNMTDQKCHIIRALPTSYRGLLCLRRNAITSPPSTGAVLKAQQCHHRIAPASFIWCRQETAVMPVSNRTKGRVISCEQKCQIPHALPNQFNGVIVKTQKCRDIVAPRGEPSKVRRDASIVPLSQTSHKGSVHARRNAFATSPHGRAVKRSQTCLYRGALPPVTGGHPKIAEMQCNPRPHRIWAILVAQKCHEQTAQ